MWHRYAPLPAISTVSPALGPTVGGTVIRVVGSAFSLAAAAGRMQCRFEVGGLRHDVDILPYPQPAGPPNVTVAAPDLVAEQSNATWNDTNASELGSGEVGSGSGEYGSGVDEREHTAAMSLYRA